MKKQLIRKLIFGLVSTYLVLLILMVIIERTDPNGNIKSFFDAFWYSIVTLATVGYGDYYPVTVAGKFIGIILIISSVFGVGYVIGNLTNKINNYMEKKKEGYFGTNFKNHIVIVGWDKFAQRVTDQIVRANKQVVVVTNTKENIDLIRNIYKEESVFTLFSDYNQIEALEKANISESSALYINFQDDTEILVYILHLKKYYPGLNIIVALNNENLKETFSSAGVTYALSKNEIASNLVASFIFEPDVAALTEDLMSTSDSEDDFDIQEYRITEKNPYLNKKYSEVFFDLKTNYNGILLGISKIKDMERILYKNPANDMLVEQGDYLLLLSDGVTKKKVSEAFGISEGR